VYELCIFNLALGVIVTLENILWTILVFIWPRSLRNVYQVWLWILDLFFNETHWTFVILIVADFELAMLWWAMCTCAHLVMKKLEEGRKDNNFSWSSVPLVWEIAFFSTCCRMDQFFEWVSSVWWRNTFLFTCQCKCAGRNSNVGEKKLLNPFLIHQNYTWGIKKQWETWWLCVRFCCWILNLAPVSRFKISRVFLVWFVIVEMSTSTIGTKLPEQAKWTKTNPISNAQITM